MNFPSKLIENAVNEMSKLPGIGQKTALRLVMFLLKSEEGLTEQLATSIQEMRQNIKQCKRCFNLSDEETCKICQNPSRDPKTICVIETAADLMAVENTGQYQGVYHVLGGVISPIEGIGPDDLKVAELLERAGSGEVEEVILAMSATMEADTTAFYLTKKLRDKGVKVSSIARGVPVGSELEYTDEVTLGRSIVSRVNYE